MNDMGALEAVVLPLATFWVVVSTMQSAATFVNGLREQVVTGGNERCAYTLAHRKALYLDWQLSMLGTIAAAFGFSGLIVAVAGHIARMPGGGEVVKIFYVVATDREYTRELEWTSDANVKLPHSTLFGGRRNVLAGNVAELRHIFAEDVFVHPAEDGAEALHPVPWLAAAR